MPFCPNCGSYVSPGANVCSCGTTFGHDLESEKKESQRNFKNSRKKKEKLATAIIKKRKS